jgi:16S rRNA (adenine1518-N6/adenine1519-N6)-dimethyltransferase
MRKLFTPAFIAATLDRYGLSLKKRYGQNYLINRKIAERILEYADVRGNDTVLEIGPGLGSLTFLLAAKARKVVSVEIDSGVVRFLGDAVKELGATNVEIVHGDFLAMGAGDLLGWAGRPDGQPNRFSEKVVSNFPYSIGTRAILKILRELPAVTGITGMLQRDLAERMTAGPGSKSYAALSVTIQYRAHIRIVVPSVSAGNFFPRPDVVSAIVSIRPKLPSGSVDHAAFDRVVRAGFANRRKSLVGNLLTSGVARDRHAVSEYVGDAFGDPKIRAERLAIDDFVSLTGFLLNK